MIFNLSLKKGMKLISVKRSKRRKFRFTATFQNHAEELQVSFGKRSSKHFIDHKDDITKKVYYTENWKSLQNFDLTSPEYLEWFILNDSTDLFTGVERYQVLLLKLGTGRCYALAPEWLRKWGVLKYKREMRALSVPTRVCFTRGRKME